MTQNAEIVRSGNENSMSVIRKFTRKVQGTGLVRTLRNKRYHSRAASPHTMKKGKLKRLARQEKFAQLLKEGKVSERPKRR